MDGEEETRWTTDANVGACWLEVDLGKPQTFDRAMIDECIDFGVRVLGMSVVEPVFPGSVRDPPNAR